jgi:hypothetical protein
MRPVIFVLIVLLAACQKPPEKAQLSGRYSVAYYGGTDTLVVNLDGSYEHQTLHDEVADRTEGTWQFESVGRERLGVTFNEFSFRTKEGARGPKGIWHTELENDGRLKLCFIYDQDICFRKVE